MNSTLEYTITESLGAGGWDGRGEGVERWERRVEKNTKVLVQLCYAQIVVGVGAQAPQDVVIPETAQRSTSREPIKINNVGYDSLELLEINVKEELGHTKFVDLSEEEGNQYSSGNNSVSNTV